MPPFFSGDNVGELTIANVRPSFTAVEVSAYTPTSMDDDSGWGSTDYESSEYVGFFLLFPNGFDEIGFFFICSSVGLCFRSAF